MASSRQASSEIRQVMDTQTPRDVAESLPMRREESAKQSAVTQLLDPGPPAFGVAFVGTEACGNLTNPAW